LNGLAQHLLVLLLFAGGCDRGRWSDHDAHRRCAPAIDAWPAEPAPPCEALSMCANEATLNPRQHAQLARMMAAAACPPP
jgi:hypothetical protein